MPGFFIPFYAIMALLGLFTFASADGYLGFFGVTHGHVGVPPESTSSIPCAACRPMRSVVSCVREALCGVTVML